MITAGCRAKLELGRFLRECCGITVDFKRESQSLRGVDRVLIKICSMHLGSICMLPDDGITDLSHEFGLAAEYFPLGFFKLAPDLMRPGSQLRINVAFGNCQPRNARMAMRRA
jgi:hypothetical protein